MCIFPITTANLKVLRLHSGRLFIYDLKRFIVHNFFKQNDNCFVIGHFLSILFSFKMYITHIKLKNNDMIDKLKDVFYGKD